MIVTVSGAVRTMEDCALGGRMGAVPAFVSGSPPQSAATILFWNKTGKWSARFNIRQHVACEGQSEVGCMCILIVSLWQE